MQITTVELFLIAMVIIFTIPYLIWRLGRTDYWAPLVVVQIVMGVILGPGILGAAYPDYYEFVFTPPVIQSLNGIAWWAVIIFVWIAGIELDLKKAWESKKESGITAGFALGMPLLFGCAAAAGLLMFSDGLMGEKASTWQFMLGVGMGCAVTALPILILLMEKMDILRQPLGQRILRYASLDDIAIWAVLALILLDWHRVERQAIFLCSFIVLSYLFRKLMARISESDRWYSSFIWLAVVSLAADWAGLHFMVGAFLAGVVMDRAWFNNEDMDKLRYFVVLIIMPVFFLSTGLRTNWDVGATEVFVVAGVLLFAQIAGKLSAAHIAGKILNWKKGEASIIGWLLQTKALIEIIFATVLLDREIITPEMFTALLLMAITSTMLTVPIVTPKLQKMKELILRSK
jgi:Kef-type K+ transport system membrane component KefB